MPLVVRVRAEAEAVRVDLVTHYASLGSTQMVMCTVRLLIRYARPCARGMYRLSVTPSSAHARETNNVLGSALNTNCAFATAASSTFPTSCDADLRENCSTRRASSTWSPRIWFRWKRRLLGAISGW